MGRLQPALELFSTFDTRLLPHPLRVGFPRSQGPMFENARIPSDRRRQGAVPPPWVKFTLRTSCRRTWSNPMKESFLEYFRCPSSFVDFRLSGPLSLPAGFFRFGLDEICCALSSGRTFPEPRDLPVEFSVNPEFEHHACILPFDPDEIIQNLRYERYRSALPSAPWNTHSLVRATYYGIRPLLPIAVRKHLQRFALNNWRDTPFPRWPVDQTVDCIFEKLMAAVLRATALPRIPFIWFWPEGHPSAA